ncbi:holo-ACP synthase [bacterium]|nr:holo-ACP synthase [bacterium]
MIFGIGTDIVEIERIKKSHLEYGDKFLKRIFTGEEIDYCLKKENPYPSLAVRFASKEALVKAARVGRLHAHTWTDVSVEVNPEGIPHVFLFNELKKHLQSSRIHISVSHSHSYATAVVIIEK